MIYTQIIENSQKKVNIKKTIIINSLNRYAAKI